MEQEAMQAIQLIVGGVPNLDQWLMEFIKNNWMTLSGILGVLKILAIEAKWATGNKIIEFVTGFLPKKGKK